MGPRKLWCASSVGLGGAQALSVRILPARKIKNMGPWKLWCASGMDVEGAQAPSMPTPFWILIGGEILGGGKYGIFFWLWRNNLAGDSATIEGVWSRNNIQTQTENKLKK